MRPEKITNLQLTCADIPEPDAPLQDVMAFALSFNGYDYAGDFTPAADMWKTLREQFEVGKPLGENLSELRTALFFEQRRTHDYWGGADEPFVRAVLAAIRHCVCPA